MIILGATREIKGQKKYCAVGTGIITTEPDYRTVGDKDIPVCNFLINADTRGKGTEKTFDSYSVHVWGTDAAYASNFEKGDSVFLFGECTRDKYRSEKNGRDEFSIRAEFIVPTATGTQILQLMQALSALSIESNNNGTNIDDSALYNYQSMDMPEVLGGKGDVQTGI